MKEREESKHQPDQAFTLLTPEEMDKALGDYPDDGEVEARMKAQLAKDEASTESLIEENTRLRALLWANHPCEGKYGDDGELQCNRFVDPIDFKRERVGELERKCAIHNCDRQGVAIPDFLKATK